MPLNRFSNLEEKVSKREFLIEFKKMNITSDDELFNYDLLYKKSKKEFRFTIIWMYIFGFLDLFVFGLIGGVLTFFGGYGFLFSILPGFVILFFAFRFSNRLSTTTKELNEAIEEYTLELQNTKST